MAEKEHTMTIPESACPVCEGNGFVRNPDARYSEEYAYGRPTGQYSTNDDEEIDCPECGGIGIVAPRQPAVPTTDTEEPF